MKTLLVTFAAAMIASTTVFAADGLFDVNDAPANYEKRVVQTLDYEPTASSSASPYVEIDQNYKPMDNDKLFD